MIHFVYCEKSIDVGSGMPVYVMDCWMGGRPSAMIVFSISEIVEWGMTQGDVADLGNVRNDVSILVG